MNFKIIFVLAIIFYGLTTNAQEVALPSYKPMVACLGSLYDEMYSKVFSGVPFVANIHEFDEGKTLLAVGGPDPEGGEGVYFFKTDGDAAAFKPISRIQESYLMQGGVHRFFGFTYEKDNQTIWIDVTFTDKRLRNDNNNEVDLINIDKIVSADKNWKPNGTINEADFNIQSLDAIAALSYSIPEKMKIVRYQLENMVNKSMPAPTLAKLKRKIENIFDSCISSIPSSIERADIAKARELATTIQEGLLKPGSNSVSTEGPWSQN